MKIKRLLLVVIVLSLLLMGAIAGLTYYYYTHPWRVKNLLENSFAQRSKAVVNIGTLEYSISPLHLKAGHITVRSSPTGGKFLLSLEEFEADMRLVGGLGERSLVFEKLLMHGLSINVSGQPVLTKQSRQGEKQQWSLTSRIIKKLVAFFLFKEIRLEGAEVVNSRITAQLPQAVIQFEQVHASLHSDGRLEVSSTANFSLPSEEISFSSSDIHLLTEGVVSLLKPNIECLVTLRGGVLHSPEASVEAMEVRARFKYHLNTKRLDFGSIIVDARRASMRRLAASSRTPIMTHVSANGSLDLREESFSVPVFQLTVEGLAQLQGALKGNFGAQPKVYVEIREASVIPAGIAWLLPGDTKKKLRAVALTGIIKGDGLIRAAKTAAGWLWDTDLRGRLENNVFSYSTERARVAATLNGRISARGKLPFPQLFLSMTIDKALAAVGGIELQSFEAGFSLSGRYPRFLIEEVTAELPVVRLPLGPGKKLFSDVHLRAAEGTVDISEKSVSIPHLRFHSSILKNLQLALDVRDQQAHLSLRGERTHLFEALAALGLLPSDWQVEGVDSIRIESTVRPGRETTFWGRIVLEKVALQNKEQSIVAEGLSLTAEAKGRKKFKEPAVEATISLLVPAGEMLYDRFYLNLGENAFSARTEATYDLAAESLKMGRMVVDLKNLLTVEGTGSMQLQRQGRPVHARLSLGRAPLRPIFQHFLVEPFKSENALLPALQVSGTVSGEFSLSSNGSQKQGTGHLRWRDGSLVVPEKKIGIEGIKVDFPISYQSGSKGTAGKAVNGFLAVEILKLPLFSEQPLHLNLESVGNTLRVKNGVELFLPGGKVSLGRIEVRNPYSGRPHLQTSMAIDIKELQPLLHDMWPRPINGDVTGRLAPIVVEKDTITTSGHVTVHVFDGELLISDLGASAIYSPAPLLRCNVKVKDLNLDLATRGTGFGRVQGILSGYVNDLEIVDGQPQSFDLLLQTVKKKGVRQKISLKAIDHIAQLGGAQSPFMGAARLLTPFFKHFSYRKMGVRASLQNDIFKVNGIVKEGGKEYLVRRAGLTGVDVINQNVDNRVSFKDMVGRLKRITADSTGPVIK
ncbi:MAG: hypothetical protein JRJ12_02215 [Deltaproteobacteria bacterium]|nr:hypothetical protein [Deltaproteobacteria bacterium]